MMLVWLTTWPVAKRIFNRRWSSSWINCGLSMDRYDDIRILMAWWSTLVVKNCGVATAKRALGTSRLDLQLEIQRCEDDRSTGLRLMSTSFSRSSTGSKTSECSKACQIWPSMAPNILHLSYQFIFWCFKRTKAKLNQCQELPCTPFLFFKGNLCKSVTYRYSVSIWSYRMLIVGIENNNYGHIVAWCAVSYCSHWRAARIFGRSGSGPVAWGWRADGTPRSQHLAMIIDAWRCLQALYSRSISSSSSADSRRRSKYSYH